MSEEKSSTSTGGIGFLGALFLVLLVLKCTDHIDTSWFWVSAPLWGPLALVLAGGTVFLVVVAVVKLVQFCRFLRRDR